jgi:hypothetical protein
MGGGKGEDDWMEDWNAERGEGEEESKAWSRITRVCNTGEHGKRKRGNLGKRDGDLGRGLGKGMKSGNLPMVYVRWSS